MVDRAEAHRQSVAPALSLISFMSPAEFENRVEELIGSQLSGVRYHEIDYFNGDGQPLAEPQWGWCPDFDSLDYGLDLLTEDSGVFHVTWGTEFTQYGVTVQNSKFNNVGVQDVSVVRVWDVTRESRWTHLVGQRIVAADVFWQDTRFRTLLDDGTWSGWSDPVSYPQDLRLAFEGGACVYLSAFEVREGDFRAAMTDHVSVFFDAAAAEEYGIGPFAPPPWAP